jgi:predicted membrane-bound spermidine synthase
MNNGFNHDFYVTAAAVIPLLYITLFLQGQLIEDIAKTVNRIATRNVRVFQSLVSKPSRFHQVNEMVKPLLVVYVVTPVIYVVLAAPFAGIIAEALSLWALFYGSDSLTMREIVLWSMFGLLVLISAKPVMSIYTKLFYFELDERDGQIRPPNDPPRPPR